MAEGLERTRRSLDHTATSWIVQNRADLLVMVGRFPEALADAEEALAEARLIGEPGRIQGCLAERAWVRFHVGDRQGASDDLAEGRTVEGQAEPQAIIYEALMDALIEWPTDPVTAARRIAGRGRVAGRRAGVAARRSTGRHPDGATGPMRRRRCTHSSSAT